MEKKILSRQIICSYNEDLRNKLFVVIIKSYTKEIVVHCNLEVCNVIFSTATTECFCLTTSRFSDSKFSFQNAILVSLSDAFRR